jgi:hypothetical protein
VNREHQQDSGCVNRNQLKSLKRCVKTRWNSEFISAHSYLELRAHAEAATKRDKYDGPPALSALAVQIIEDYVLLMKPIFDATSTLSGETYVTGIAV